MSFFSFVNVLFIFVVLPCIFFFHPFLLLLFLLLWFLCLIKMVGYDIISVVTKPSLGFWLFLVSELILFVSILVTCLWFQDSDSVALSYAYSIPLIETVLLISSSVFITAYHSLRCSSNGYYYLVLSIVSALIFMVLAVYEVLVSEVSSLFNPHAASCYLVLGLHFSHVLIGSVLLVQLLFFPYSYFVRGNSDVYVIYWHFVDYVWLLVFVVVYLLVS